jgi:BirA family biotin operon repressor/biotin-[acetyl-CoA-carboxylase] ligase
MAEVYLDADELRRATFVRHVELHDTLGSTNDRAAELAHEATIELPALVAARIQTAGKGRGRNQWWSAEGALTFSILLDSAAIGVSQQNWPQLSLATAVAVCDALAEAVPRVSVSIKWPNDVMVDGGKVCGILIESPGGSAQAKDRLIVGIGINVNNTWRKAPHHVGANGSALCDVTGTQYNLQRLLAGILQAIQERFRQLARGDSQLPQAWQRLCWLTEHNVEVQANGRYINAACIGIDLDGALLVDTAFGIQRIRSASVRVTT